MFLKCMMLSSGFILLTLAHFCTQTKQFETKYLQPFNDFPYCAENNTSSIEECFK